MCASSIFQWVIGLHNGIVLIVSVLVAIMKDHVALLEEQVVAISLYHCSTALHIIQMLHN